jgi:transcriptional regulator with XRE-family HTH domain
LADEQDNWREAVTGAVLERDEPEVGRLENGLMASGKRITPLGEVLRAARRAFYWNQEALGKRVYVSSRTVSRWENGVADIDEGAAARLFDAFRNAPKPIVEALAYHLGMELEEEEVEPAPAPPPAQPAAPVGPRAVAEMARAPARPAADEARATLDAIVYAVAEERDLVPRHLRAFAVELLRGVDKLGLDAKEAAVLVAAPERDRGKAKPRPV